MKNNRMKDALENIALRGVPENTNLWPRIAASIHDRKSFMKTLRTRPLMIVVIAVLALLLLTGVVYAIGKVTGYFPSVGFIDLSVPVRVLAEPVSVEREGTKITVKQAVLSADSTFISYKVNNIKDGAEHCWETPRMQLSDGTMLDGGQRSYGSSNIRFDGDIKFAPIPQDISNVTLLFDCR